MPVAKTCPICGKPAVEAFKPFCSKRCADVDLNRWLSGTYVIPAKDEPAADDSTPPSGDDDEF
jgi:endogenous inhibitor of DNA gyrase (YacG/DUF329 family)